MRLVLQRVAHASVTVEGELVGQIGHGLLVLVGITDGDDEAEAEWCARRNIGARLWEDDRYSNLSVCLGAVHLVPTER